MRQGVSNCDAEFRDGSVVGAIWIPLPVPRFMLVHE